MSFTEDTKKPERKPRAKDKHGREYDEYNGKRSTVVLSTQAVVYDKADGSQGKAAKSETVGDLRVIVIPVNRLVFRVILERITPEGTEAPKP